LFLVISFNPSSKTLTKINISETTKFFSQYRWRFLMKKLLSTRDVAAFLGINEKMVYSLVSEKGLPASKVTGKWLFPKHLVEQWIENNTVNFPDPATKLPPYDGLLVITGSNDILLDKTIALFNNLFPDQVAVFGNLGSLGGLRALRQNLCHMAASHLLQENEEEYNFDFAGRELDKMPVIVNFCMREQGLIVQKGNPRKINSFADLGKPGLRIVNRPLGTGTRLLFDHELSKTGLKGEKLDGYDHELGRHMDVGLEVLSGRSDAGPGIKPVATLLGLDFIPLRMERFDILITKERFFDKGVQYFLGILHEKPFRDLAADLNGYNTEKSGRMVYPQENNGSV
jgi:putative molybdopterin biosynthesis protein